MASVVENNTRFFRALLILIKEGRNVLLYLFRHRIYASGDIEKFLKENKCSLKELKKKKVISHGQWTKLFPKPQEDTWDIGLIILLLQNICGIDVSSTEKNSIAAYLKRFREIRNEVQGHIAEPSISAEMFIDLCSELSMILKALSSSVPGSDTFVHECEKRINEYLETPLDPKQFQMLKDEIQDVSTMLMWLSDKLDASTNKILDEIKAKENVASVHRVYLKDQEAQTNETMILQFSECDIQGEVTHNNVEAQTAVVICSEIVGNGTQLMRTIYYTGLTNGPTAAITKFMMKDQAASSCENMYTEVDGCGINIHSGYKHIETQTHSNTETELTKEMNKNRFTMKKDKNFRALDRPYRDISYRDVSKLSIEVKTPIAFKSTQTDIHGVRYESTQATYSDALKYVSNVQPGVSDCGTMMKSHISSASAERDITCDAATFNNKIDSDLANEAKVRKSVQTEKREERVLAECCTMAKPHLSSKHTQTEINTAKPIPQNMKAMFDESKAALLNSSIGKKVRLPCKHDYDIDALDSLVKFEINDGQKKLRCLRSNCCQTLDMQKIASILKWSPQVFNHYADKLNHNRLDKQRLSTASTDVITVQLEDTLSVSPDQLNQASVFSLENQSVNRKLQEEKSCHEQTLSCYDSMGSRQKCNKCNRDFLKGLLSMKDNDILDCCCSKIPFN